MVNMLFICLRLEKMKREKNIQIYKEILNYMEKRTLSNPKK